MPTPRLCLSANHCAGSHSPRASTSCCSCSRRAKGYLGLTTAAETTAAAATGSPFAPKKQGTVYAHTAATAMNCHCSCERCTAAAAADRSEASSLLQLLLGAQLVGVAALLLPAVLGTGVQAGVAPEHEEYTQSQQRNSEPLQSEHFTGSYGSLWIIHTQ